MLKNDNQSLLLYTVYIIEENGFDPMRMNKRIKTLNHENYTWKENSLLFYNKKLKGKFC